MPYRAAIVAALRVALHDGFDPEGDAHELKMVARAAAGGREVPTEYVEALIREAL